jgi:hypothetical protein
MILEPGVRMSLTPEEGAVLGQLADSPHSVMHFTPVAQSKAGYQSFNTDVVWPLEQLQRRGLVEITQRVAADTGGAATYWNAVAAALTPDGWETAAGRPRNSLGEPGIPEG